MRSSWRISKESYYWKHCKSTYTYGMCYMRWSYMRGYLRNTSGGYLTHVSTQQNLPTMPSSRDLSALGLTKEFGSRPGLPPNAAS